MCGITGFVSLNSSDETIISKMTNSLNSRGPDHQSFWTDNSGSISLGHTRLSFHSMEKFITILILEKTSIKKPISNGKETVTLKQYWSHLVLLV